MLCELLNRKQLENLKSVQRLKEKTSEKEGRKSDQMRDCDVVIKPLDLAGC
jgi:hypothetical protein